MNDKKFIKLERFKGPFRILSKISEERERVRREKARKLSNGGELSDHQVRNRRDRHDGKRTPHQPPPSPPPKPSRRLHRRSPPSLAAPRHRTRSISQMGSQRVLRTRGTPRERDVRRDRRLFTQHDSSPDPHGHHRLP